jgi:hypothetical protein
VREPNAIDFWRGFALITIFINHIPGNAFQRFTYSQYSISDAAELFVFLAGWSLALATEGKGAPDPPGRVLLRIASRTVEVYIAQGILMLLALGLIAGAALVLNNPILLEWHNAGPFFADPIQTTVGVVLLTHQLGYFNILPLYVGLLALAPLFVLLARGSRWLALSVSFALYALCLTFQINLPSWPVEGRWFFNPLAWQFLFVLGFLSSLWARDSEAFRLWAQRLMPVGVLGVAIGLIVSVREIRIDPYSVPEPRLFFVLDKSYVSPLRLLSFIALVLAFQGVFDVLAQRLPRLAAALSALGRNSLSVFSVGSITGLAIQLIRATLPRSIVLDAVLVGSGILLLLFTAWFVEWRSRSPRPSSLRH